MNNNTDQLPNRPTLQVLDQENIYALLARSGIGVPIEIQQNLSQGRVRVNDSAVTRSSMVKEGDRLTIGALTYVIERSSSGHFCVLPDWQNTERISGRRLIQCGYHKCLTMYFRKVFGRIARTPFTGIGNFTHFFHRLDEFYRRCEEFSIASISGHALDLDRFENVLVTRFIRDPRDLLVSGYFYHRRAAESWCDLVNPVDQDWQVVNGKVPDCIPAGLSFSQYLNKAPQEQGLLAELEFRENHFDGMMQWSDDPRVSLFHYEEMIGNEAATYDRMFEFYGFPGFARVVGRHYAQRYSAARQQAKSGHIRNASSGQWRDYFTPKLKQRFDQRYGELIDKLGYPHD